MKDIRIALAISQSVPFEIQKNFEGMTQWTRAAKAEGAALICFPEMNLTGYTNSPLVRQAAQAIPGPITQKLAALSQKENMVILAGMAEKDPDDHFFISHLAAMPSGELGVYRKVHIAPPEQGVFSPGNEVPLFEASGVKFGVQLCYDAHFPDLSTLMAQKGADIIFVPHASPRGTPEDKFRSWQRHLPARAYDNSLFVAACNPTGKTEKGLHFPGTAMIIDPSGNIMGRKLGDWESLMIIDLKTEALERVRNHKMRFFFPNRRPGLYERAGNL